MTTTRREFVIGTGADSCGRRSWRRGGTHRQDKSVEKLLAGFAEELLVEYPESATRSASTTALARA